MENLNELIPIEESNGKKAVSARYLHTFLESKQEFTNWIKNRIDKYGLIENIDYQVFDNFIKNPNGGRPLTEYVLSIDAAKELSMVEGNEKGKQARRYFIACEKIATSDSYAVPKLQDLTAARMMAADYTIKTLNLNEASKLPLIKAINEPLGLPTPDYVESKGVLITMTQIVEGTGISPQKANKILAQYGILESHTRKTSKGKDKAFWVITEQYSDWGENEVHPQSQNEVQVKWYEHKRKEILLLITNKIAA
jgi:phage anti-repressor protein|nr:MAG TPA: AntA/AntB antirepressor [Caudoviricetes sp.]